MQEETIGQHSCDVCGALNREGARFCKNCGASLLPPQTCPACETAIPLDARFCPGCGVRVVGRRPNVGQIEGSSIAASSSNYEEDARREIDSVKQALPARNKSSGILGNLILFAAGLVVIIIVMREWNIGKPKEVSPFESGPPPSVMTPESKTPVGGKDFEGLIELAPGMTAPNGTLFIIARIQGSPDRGPPVAVRRVSAPRFPFKFRLGPADVMLQGMPFDGPFDVRARLDADGNVMTKAPGDLFSSTPAPAQPGAKDVKVTLDARIE